MTPFVQIKEHVLLPFASELDKVNSVFSNLLTPHVIQAVTELIPGEWLAENNFNVDAAAMRTIYQQFLTSRIRSSDIFVKEAQHARETLI